MGQERAAILDVDFNTGCVTLPLQFKGKLRFSKKVYVATFPDGNGNCHLMSINQDQRHPKNNRDIKTNRVIQYSFEDGVIPVSKFIGDEAFSHQVVVWYSEESKELVFQCVFSN